jgi:CheY-like chemotaxis protein
MDHLQGDRVDVIVCDIRLPYVPGHNLIVSLRRLPEERGRRTPAIAFTAYASADDERAAIANGFDAYVGRPRIYELPRIVWSVRGR